MKVQFSATLLNGKMEVRNREAMSERIKRSFKDGNLIVTIEEREANKSLDQLRYYHGPLMDGVVDVLYNLGYQLSKSQARSFIESQNPFLSDEILDPQGNPIEIRAGVSGLSKEKMSKVIDWTVFFCAENGLEVLSGEEYLNS
jgi:hypothetical protein